MTQDLNIQKVYLNQLTMSKEFIIKKEWENGNYQTYRTELDNKEGADEIVIREVKSFINKYGLNPSKELKSVTLTVKEVLNN